MCDLPRNTSKEAQTDSGGIPTGSIIAIMSSALKKNVRMVTSFYERDGKSVQQTSEKLM